MKRQSTCQSIQTENLNVNKLIVEQERFTMILEKIKVRIYLRNLLKKDNGCLTINKDMDIEALCKILSKMCIRYPEKYINIDKRYRFEDDNKGVKNYCLQVQKVVNNKVVATKYVGFRENLFSCEEIIGCFIYWAEHSDELVDKDKKIMKEVNKCIFRK